MKISAGKIFLVLTLAATVAGSAYVRFFQEARSWDEKLIHGKAARKEKRVDAAAAMDWDGTENENIRVKKPIDDPQHDDRFIEPVRRSLEQFRQERQNI